MRKLTRRFIAIAIAALLLFSNDNPAGANGDLDPGFGNSGKVTTDFSGSSDYINAIAIQPDGKIVAAGAADNSAGSSDFALARYNVDGSLDPTFGSEGKVTTDFFGKNDEARGVVIQPDRKIVVAGRALTGPDGFNLALARYNADGSLDASFGSGGKITADFSGKSSSATGVAMQNDGRIIAAGYAQTGSADGTRSFALARYNSDGSLDASFGSGGKATTAFFNDYDAALAIAIQADGRIIAAGFANNSSRIGVFALIRFDPSQQGPPPPTPAFTLRFDSPEVSAERGTTVVLPINIVRTGGHTSTVTITPPDIEALKIKVKPPDPVSTTGTSAKFKLKIKGGAPIGSHQITFTGNDLYSHSIVEGGLLLMS